MSVLPPDIHRDYIRAFLIAWRDSIYQQAMLLPYLGRAVGSDSPHNVFYRWAIPPHCPSRGELTDSGWRYHFLDRAGCELFHEDGRYLQINFGPRGRIDVFSPWSTFHYIMSSRRPWGGYPLLKAMFAEHVSLRATSQTTTSMRRVTQFLAPLNQLPLFKPAEPTLAALKQSIQFDPTRSLTLSPTHPKYWDYQVADRRVLKRDAKRLFEKGIPQDEFADLWQTHVA